MAYIINDQCINCGACDIECPVNAVAETNKSILVKGKIIRALSTVHYFINIFICDECFLYNQPKCFEVCPMNAIEKY